jgi:hypothetical protein
MKKVLSLATAIIFMAGLATAQQGPTPAKTASKESTKKECSGEHKSCCAGKTTASAASGTSASKCSGEKKACCSGHKAEAASKPASTTVKK